MSCALLVLLDLLFSRKWELDGIINSLILTGLLMMRTEPAARRDNIAQLLELEISFIGSIPKKYACLCRLCIMHKNDRRNTRTLFTPFR